MNTTRLDLSKELSDVSNWKDTDFGYQDYGNDYTPRIVATNENIAFDYPAYDLSYLLDKLEKYGVELYQSRHKDMWYCKVKVSDSLGYAITKEDAVAKLCIDLFAKGILK